jgi:light-independent protochlorophyllide reductase subunit B
MGLEEHLIGMFRHDFEFVDGHRSHLGEAALQPAAQNPALATAHVPGAVASGAAAGTVISQPSDLLLSWTVDGEAELAKIPFFVRSKVRRNTEAYAREQGLERIDSEALYAAKAHFSS